MYINSAQIKKILPFWVLQSIRALRLANRKLESVVEQLAFPIKKTIYGSIINIFPRRQWVYERILKIIWQHRNSDVLKYSKLFLHYLQFYRELNPECIIRWRIEICVAYLMLQDTRNLEKSMQDVINMQDDIIKQKNWIYSE
jgi:hypothetical protein